MHISYKPLWHTLLERDMRKEDLRLAAGMTTNMIANMSKEDVTSLRSHGVHLLLNTEALPVHLPAVLHHPVQDRKSVV